MDGIFPPHPDDLYGAAGSCRFPEFRVERHVGYPARLDPRRPYKPPPVSMSRTTRRHWSDWQNWHSVKVLREKDRWFGRGAVPCLEAGCVVLGKTDAPFVDAWLPRDVAGRYFAMHIQDVHPTCLTKWEIPPPPGLAPEINIRLSREPSVPEGDPSVAHVHFPIVFFQTVRWTWTWFSLPDEEDQLPA